MASDMNLIGDALLLLKDDLKANGLVCGYCESINYERMPTRSQCGAPMGCGIPIADHFIARADSGNGSPK